MKKVNLRVLVAVALLAAFLLISGFGDIGRPRVHSGTLSDPFPAPEFTQQDAGAWLKSAPLKIADLRGSVVLIDFWTYECWNCYRSFPWLNSLQQEYASKGLKVIGIHTPEFDHEKDVRSVARKMEEFELNHPVMIDNDSAYWKKMRNRFWPAFYILDKKGRVRAAYYGETHAGDTRAKKIDKLVRKLLAEGG